MRKFIASPIIAKLVLGSVLYLLLLITSLWWGPSVWGDDPNFPSWVELVLKVLAVLAFGVVALLPIVHVIMHIGKKGFSKPLAIAAGITIGGYALLFVQLLYVKLRTCDPQAIPYDERWHCQYEGKSAIVYFVLIPVLAGLIGMAASGFTVRNNPPKTK